MNQNDMAGLIAETMGGKVGENGEILANGFEVVNSAQPDIPSSDAMSGNEPPTPPADPNPPTPPADDKSSLNIDFDKILAEKTGGKYKSLEDLTKVEQTSFSNDLVAKINEFSKKYTDPQKALELFVKTQTTDYSQMSAEEAVKTKIKMDNPEFTEKEVDYEFRNKYKQDADLYAEEEVEIGRTRLERDAKSAVDELIKTQQELATKGDVDPEADAKEQEHFMELKRQWDEKAEKSVAELSKLDVKISDKENFEWKFGDEDKKEAAELVKSMGADSSSFFNMFKNEAGEYEHGKIASAYLKLKKFDAIIGAAVEQALNAGKQSEIKDLKNTNFEPAKNPNNPTALSMEEQVAQQMGKFI